MPRFKRLPVNDSVHIIIDGIRFPTDKEYTELGVREGWLILYRIVSTKGEPTEYLYKYPGTI